MKTTLIFCILFFVSSASWARLDENLEQLKTRFGEPRQLRDESAGTIALPDGKKLQRYVFAKEGVPFVVISILENDKVVCEVYQRSASKGTDADVAGAAIAFQEATLWEELKTQIEGILEANAQGKSWTMASFQGVDDLNFKKVSKGNLGLDIKCQRLDDMHILKAWKRDDNFECELQLAGDDISAAVFSPRWREVNKIIAEEAEKAGKEKERQEKEKKKEKLGI